jgi:hypothetical protein
MKPPRFRIRTLTLLVLVVALAIALGLELEQARKARLSEALARANPRFLPASGRHTPPALKVTGLKPFRLTRAQEARPDWSNNTRDDFVTAVKRAFNWALDEELIEKNPVARAKKPARDAREVIAMPAPHAAWRRRPLRGDRVYFPGRASGRESPHGMVRRSRRPSSGSRRRPRACYEL